VDPGSLLTALRRLDPASRALLDLSLRRGVDDESIAGLLGTDAETVAADRDRTIERVAATAAAGGPEDALTVREAIASLPAERWAEASPEAAPPGTGRAPAGPPRSAEPVPPASVQSDEPWRPGPHPDWLSGGGSSARPQRAPAKRRSPAGPLAVGAVLLIALAVLLGMLLSSGDDDGSPGTDGGSQTVGEGEGAGAERPAPAAGASGGETESRDGGGSGEQSRPGGRDGRGGGEANAPAAAALEPLPGKLDTGRGTARLEGEGEEAAVSLSVTGLPAPDGEYEVWLYNSLSDARSLGRFAGRQIELFQPLAVDPADYRFLDVSVEPADGNKNHSGQSVLRAPLEELRQQP